MIQLNHICKNYSVAGETQAVLKEIALDIQSSECLAIVGPSGSGKSTLMNILGLLDRPSSGTYLLDHRDVSSLKEDEAALLRNQYIGFVFQQFYLLPRLKVIDNVILPLTYGASSMMNMKQKAMHYLDAVGIADKADYYPNQLSGGQQQRVAIARALVNEPQMILADEPTGALDSQTSARIMELFFSIQEKTKSTLVVITHDVQVAKMCARQVKIKDGMLE